MAMVCLVAIATGSSTAYLMLGVVAPDKTGSLARWKYHAMMQSFVSHLVISFPGSDRNFSAAQPRSPV